MSDIKTKIERLNNMIQTGKALEAFEELYDDGVVMQENSQPPTVGKGANRDRELQFFAGVKAWHKADVQSVAVGDDVTAVEWELDYEHKEFGRRSYRQVALQKWKNGKIVSETFYYGA